MTLCIWPWNKSPHPFFAEYIMFFFFKAIILRGLRTEPCIWGASTRQGPVTESIQVNKVGGSEMREAILAESDRWINALKGRAKGQAAQWQLRDSL